MEEHGELIFELFSEWYGVQNIRLAQFTKFSDQKFRDIWQNLWFAKKEQQTKMDIYLKKYGELFTIDNPDDIIPKGLNNWNTIVWKVGWLIVWDQISRNIFRNTKYAYATDFKARKLVEELMPLWKILPIPIRVSIILVYIHSEDINDLQIVNRLLDDIKEPMRNFDSVWQSLTGIARNHSDRMKEFGRIPERNKFLGRESTDKELAYMSCM